MPQMPALAHPTTKSVPSLQNGDFEATCMLQQDIGASQASESGSDDTDADG
jgi:hypothetical protein